jgi:crotonobetainyl-CoA:carnitine CoA-transferase CaiB-like acyl-CoA transferase
MDPARLQQLLDSAGIALPDGASVAVAGSDPVLPSKFPIGEVAAAALAACAAQAAQLWTFRGGAPQRPRVDVRAAAASLLSFAHTSVDGVPLVRQNAANPTVAMYRCSDGRWIHLHGGFPGLRDGTLALLECDDDAPSIAAAVRRWDAQQLEDALAERGLCGAMVRTDAEWSQHPQAKALTRRPAVEVLKVDDADPRPFTHDAAAPLDGVRVLDLTRVLAGPSSARTLAQHGADVLHLTSPNLPSIDAFDIDTGHGKRSAHIDLDDTTGREQLRALIAGADVFIDGYRTGALDRRGFGPDDVLAIRPGTVHVAVNCYGHEGPWAARPGWEQLAQSATGVAAAQGTPDAPRLIAAAACDYTTGYLAAFGAMVALARRAVEGGSWLVRASLCQTAMWIEHQGATLDPAAATGVGDAADLMTESKTPYGVVRHLRPPIDLSETPARWTRPTVPLGQHAPSWD